MRTHVLAFFLSLAVSFGLTGFYMALQARFEAERLRQMVMHREQVFRDIVKMRDEWKQMFYENGTAFVERGATYTPPPRDEL